MHEVQNDVPSRERKQCNMHHLPFWVLSSICLKGLADLKGLSHYVALHHLKALALRIGRK